MVKKDTISHRWFLNGGQKGVSGTRSFAKGDEKAHVRVLGEGYSTDERWRIAHKSTPVEDVAKLN